MLHAMFSCGALTHMLLIMLSTSCIGCLLCETFQHSNSLELTPAGLAGMLSGIIGSAAALVGSLQADNAHALPAKL
jgi:sugar phosphate permease